MLHCIAENNVVVVLMLAVLCSNWTQPGWTAVCSIAGIEALLEELVLLLIYVKIYGGWGCVSENHFEPCLDNGAQQFTFS